ncbi:MAG: DUF4054 domain-containing protein [Treponema sp.]|jgi:hypothetical protein|nr:DUF4054 domain-containing protein [Treponema sp.]
MALSPEQVIATICPELSGSPSFPVYWEMAVQYIRANYVQGFFRSLYNMASAYLCCHYFSLMGDSRGGGGSNNPYAGMPVSGMSENGQSITFAAAAAASGDENSFSSTKYGVMFLQLEKRFKKSIPRMGVNTAGLYGV